MIVRKLSKLLSAATFALALGATAGASADATGFVQVASVWQYANSTNVHNGNTYVFLKDTSCGTAGYFIIRGDNTKQSYFHSMLLAAQLSGKTVAFTYDASTCVAHSVHIK